MTYNKSLKKTVVASALLLSFVSLNTQASECKGLDNKVCTENAACSWVEAYQRKDGREINAFCRTSTKGRTKISAKSKKALKTT